MPSWTPSGRFMWGRQSNLAIAEYWRWWVVPLVLIGFEVRHNPNLSCAAVRVRAYKRPIYCFAAVAFWNLVGAGIFGFLTNPPLALYCMQGLNTTPVHGHTALSGLSACSESGSCSSS